MSLKEEAMTLALSSVLPQRLVRTTPATVAVRTYGTMWDIRTTVIRLYLAHAGIIGDFIDVTSEAAGVHAKSLPVPSVSIDGEWLHTPQLRQLEEALARHGLTHSGVQSGPSAPV
jgi:hypothetical protein